MGRCKPLIENRFQDELTAQLSFRSETSGSIEFYLHEPLFEKSFTMVASGEMSMQKAKPPGPTEGPLVQMFQYVRDPYGFFERHQRTYGDVFSMNLPGIGHQVAIASPEGLRELTVGS